MAVTFTTAWALNSRASCHAPSLLCQVITGSHDSTIKLWDLRNAKALSTLTFHKKAVRCMATHPEEHAFASASADNIKKFALPGKQLLLQLCSIWQVSLHHSYSAVVSLVCIRMSFMHRSCIGKSVQLQLVFRPGMRLMLLSLHPAAGDFLHNMLSQPRAIVNSMALNHDNVMVTGGQLSLIGAIVTALLSWVLISSCELSPQL
jgi:hypothetical protein